MGSSDARTFLAWCRASCHGGLTAQLKGENLVISLTADGLKAAVSALRSLDRVDRVFTPSRSWTNDVCDFWRRTSVGVCLSASSGRSSNSEHSCPEGPRSCEPDVATRNSPRTALHCVGGATA